MPVGFCFYSFFVSKKTSVCKKGEYCLFDMGEPYGSDLYVRKVLGITYIFVEKEKNMETAVHRPGMDQPQQMPAMRDQSQ